MNDTATEMFVSNWRVYQKILEYNYMHHEAFGDYLANILHYQAAKGPAAMLDIGCGDASQVCAPLQEIELKHYKGYDLSGPALAIAKHNLEGIDAMTELVQGDMQDLLQQETAMYDVIYSSFAIHHLQDADKERLLQQCYSRLNEGGLLVYTDIFRTKAQTRPLYMAEYIFNIETSWDGLSDNEKQLVYDHVSVYDFPALLADCEQWISNAGFTIKQIYQPDKWHNMIVAVKAI